jgi:hypothetical protein
MPVSFSKDIAPLFRKVDIDHMKVHGVILDDYQYMSDATDNHAHAQAVEKTLIDQSMPPAGPFWIKEQLDLYAQWKSEGYQP